MSHTPLRRLCRHGWRCRPCHLGCRCRPCRCRCRRPRWRSFCRRCRHGCRCRPCRHGFHTHTHHTHGDEPFVATPRASPIDASGPLPDDRPPADKFREPTPGAPSRTPSVERKAWPVPSSPASLLLRRSRFRRDGCARRNCRALCSRWQWLQCAPFLCGPARLEGKLYGSGGRRGPMPEARGASPKTPWRRPTSGSLLRGRRKNGPDVRR